MKKYTITIGVVVLVILTALLVANTQVARAPTGGGQACTMEAKICPDGSAVGRSGPNCEFAECPAPRGPVTLTARIGQEVSGLGVNITPLAVIEDSRCPVDVMCIQAGRVRIQARLVSGLGTAMQEFTLDGEPITTEAEIVALVDTAPQPKAGIRIPDAEYVFQFEVTKRTANLR